MAREGAWSMATGTFGTAINCIDGRVQAPVAEWLKINCHVTWVDMVTVAGPD
ncbi:MAG: carbonic anhydrase, partial [Ktedonobacterales bacterium]